MFVYLTCFLFILASAQKWSLPCSMLALAIASAKLYFSQRLGKISDPDPTIKMIACIMPLQILHLSGLLFSLVFVASYIQSYIILSITLVTALNGLILFLTYFKSDKRKALRQIFYPKENQIGKKESGFVFFTAVLTSWISPNSVWANTFELETWFLLISSSTCTIVYFIHIVAIVLFEQLIEVKQDNI